MESPQIGVALTCTGMGRWLEEATKHPIKFRESHLASAGHAGGVF